MRRSRAAAAATAAIVTVLVGPLVALVVVAGPASAHDVLLRTAPADGAALATPPASVVLTFEEPPLDLGTAVSVTGPAGPAASGPATRSGSVVTQALLTGLPAGVYTVAWRVTSDDGHPVSGTFAFSVTAGASPAPATTAPATTAPLPTSAASALPTTTSAERSSKGLVVIAGVVLLGLALTGVTLLLHRRDVRERERGDG